LVLGLIVTDQPPAVTEMDLLQRHGLRLLGI
jgi:hypothetical protein